MKILDLLPGRQRSDTCDCKEPWLDPDDPEDYCWRCKRQLPDPDDDRDVKPEADHGAR